MDPPPQQTSHSAASAYAAYAAEASGAAAAAAAAAGVASPAAPSLLIEVAPAPRSPLPALPARSPRSRPPPRSIYRNGHDSTSSDDDADDSEPEERKQPHADADDPRSYAHLAMPPGPASRAGRLRPRSRIMVRFYLGLNRILDALPGVLDACMRGIGPVMVVAGWALFASVSYVYFHCILPVYGLDPTSGRGFPLTVFALSLLFQVYYNHIMATITKPGGIPKDWSIPANIVDLIRDEKDTLIRGETFSIYCKTCLHPKAPRMHHCHVCRTCVSRMDHHCPWINGCVGFHNYRYFYNFLFWLWCGCLFLITLTIKPVFAPTDHMAAVLYTPVDGVSPSHEGLIFFTLVLTSAAACAVGALLGLHTYLVLTNQTTIEMYANRKAAAKAKRRGDAWNNPYDLGAKRNWLSVLGAGPLLCGGKAPWLMWSFCSTPLGLARLSGNGLHYETHAFAPAAHYAQERSSLLSVRVDNDDAMRA